MVSYYSPRLAFVYRDVGWRDEYTEVTLTVDGKPVTTVTSERYQELQPFEAYAKAIRQMQTTRL